MLEMPTSLYEPLGVLLLDMVCTQYSRNLEETKPPFVPKFQSGVTSADMQYSCATSLAFLVML
jgi:hypothetical protein